ncbi:MAG: MBL fold metallo-hydrolase, partial [Actinobacteria bacterium]|nr:MBL fold metallo-hydrolase [Actinomycetota bacterium]
MARASRIGGPRGGIPFVVRPRADNHVADGPGCGAQCRPAHTTFRRHGAGHGYVAAHARGTRGVVRVRLTVIGCAGSFPSPDSPASSYLVEHARTQLLLDLGNGAFGSLLGQTDPRSIDAIIISHLHADHCADLVPLYVWLKYGPIPLPRKIPVYGPRGLAERIAGMYSAAGADLTDIFEFRTLRAQQPVDIGSMTVLPAIVAHPGESFAVRIATPSSTLVYSGDTAECDALVTLSAGADIALFEASCLESATPADA